MNFMFVKYPLILLLLCVPFNIGSQTPEVVKFTIENGLSSDGFNFHILQDDMGKIWVSSWHGITTFDGSEFKVYLENEGLDDRVALRTILGPNGKVWAMTYSGRLFYFENNRFHPYQYNDTIKSLLRRDHVWHFQMDEHENIYFGHKYYGLWQIDSSGILQNLIDSTLVHGGLGVWIPETMPPISFGIKNVSMKILPDSVLLFDQDFNLTHTLPFQFDGQTPEFRSFVSHKQNGEITLSFGTYVIRIPHHKKSFSFYKAKNLVNMFVENEEDLWVVTRKAGLLRFGKGNLDRVEPQSLFIKEDINSITMDREGGIWAGVYLKGLWYIPYPDRPRYYTDESDFPLNVIFDIEWGDSSLFCLPNYSTLYEFQNDTFKKIDWRPIVKNYKGQVLQDVFWDKTHHMLYISLSNHLLSYTNGKLEEISLPETISSKKAKMSQFIGNSDSVLYVISSIGLVEISKKETKYIPETAGQFHRGVVDNHNHVYLGAEDGLMYYNGDSLIHMGYIDSMLNSRIYRVQYTNNELIMSSSTYGLLSLKNDKVNVITKNHNNEVRWNLIPEADTLWSISDRFLYKYVKTHNEHKPYLFNKYNIQVKAGLTLLSLDIRDSIFRFTSNAGLMKVNRKEFNKKRVLPPIGITSVKFHDRDTIISEKYSVDYTQDIVQIGFSGNSFTVPEMTYRFRMSGVDRDWRHTTNKTIQYTKLTPGQYTFEVYAQTDENLESESPAKIVFIITPPYWETWWFRALCALTLLLIITYLILRRKARKDLDRANEQKLLELKSKALRSQMDPHFIFNVLAAIQSHMANNNTESSEIYLTKFSRLIRLVLENSESGYTCLGREIEMIQYYMDVEKMRLNHNFDYTITIDPKLDSETLEIPSMLVQPYIENAIIHGMKNKAKGGKIELYFSQIQNRIQCIIKDNGPGIKANTPKLKNRAHESMGMMITRERLKLLNKASFDFLDVQSLNNDSSSEGTEVRLMMPFKMAF